MEIERLDEAVALEQGRREVGKPLAADGLAPGKQLVGHGQHFERLAHALAHRRHALVGALAEGERHIVIFEVADTDEQAEGGGHAAPEREGCRESQ